MLLGSLITNHTTENHPPDKWGLLTAQRIAQMIVIDEDSGTPEAVKAREDKRQFEMRLVPIMTKYHAKVQDFEAAALSSGDHHRLMEPLDAEHSHLTTMQTAVAEIADLAKINPIFAEHFAKPDIQQHIIDDMLRVDFTSSMDVHRLCYSDKHRGHPTVEAWRTARQKHGAGHAHHFMTQYLARVS